MTRVGREITRTAVKENLERMEKFVNMGYEQFSYSFPIKLMVFPEYALSGYPAHDLSEALKVAERIPGPITDFLGEVAKKYRTYLCPGSMAEAHPKFPNVTFNSSVLINPEGKVILVYRKANPWLSDEFWPSPHDFINAGWEEPVFPVAKTEIGNMGIYICNDGATPEPARQLAFNGAEILLHPTVLMDPWIVPPNDMYDLQCKWHSFTNMCYGVNVNCAWEPFHAPPYPVQGGSNICDYQGRILSACPKAAVEAYCFDFLDVAALRAYRRTMMTHNGLANFRGELYDYSRRNILYPPNVGIKEDPTWDWAKSRAYVRKAHDRFWEDYYKDAVK